MPTTAIVSGVLLILLGIAGYAFSDLESTKRLTALIPAVVGLILLILGVVAKSNENLRKHLMHAAVVVGLLGFLLPAARILMGISDFKVSLSFLSQALMALICLFFVILSIQSFVNARRNRTGDV